MLKKQSGLSMITWMLVIALVGVQGVLAMRIIPVYINFASAQSIMDGLSSDPEASSLSTKKLKVYISKRLGINGLYQLASDKNAFKFVKQKKGLALVLHYEERGPIFGNLEFVATFDHEVALSGKR